MTMSNTPAPLPQDPLEEHERQTAINRIQRAMANDEIKFDELDDRFELVFKANTRAELTAAVADLPTPAAPAARAPGHPIAERTTSVFGDIKVGGWIEVDADLYYNTVFGDIVLDLSSASLPNDMTIKVSSLFGEISVIVPDGVRVSLDTTQIFGDRKTNLSEPYSGSPKINLKASTVFGDVRLYSMSLIPKGRLRKLWRSLRKKV